MAYSTPEHRRYPFPFESCLKIVILELSTWLLPNSLITPTYPNLNLCLIRVELPAPVFYSPVLSMPTPYEPLPLASSIQKGFAPRNSQVVVQFVESLLNRL